jgi:hypothetical protein
MVPHFPGEGGNLRPDPQRAGFLFCIEKSMMEARAVVTRSVPLNAPFVLREQSRLFARLTRRVPEVIECLRRNRYYYSGRSFGLNNSRSRCVAMAYGSSSSV